MAFWAAESGKVTEGVIQAGTVRGLGEVPLEEPRDSVAVRVEDVLTSAESWTVPGDVSAVSLTLSDGRTLGNTRELSGLSGDLAAAPSLADGVINAKMI